MVSATVENYLKQIYVLQDELSADVLVTMGRVSTAVGVTPGTATTMVKALADSGLALYEPRGGVRLTAGGVRLARQVLRRHRLIELFLVRVLHMDWAEVHAEAEELEHAISDKVLERIDAHLGYPDTDPHGDPIPMGDDDSDPAAPRLTLLDCPLEQPLVVTRVLDQTPDFLQFLDSKGLVPGATLKVTDRNINTDAVAIEPAGRQGVTLGSAAAVKILVSA